MNPVDWPPAGRRRRLGAWLLDVVLFAGTLGFGWLAWTWHCWASGETPGKRLLGVCVVDSWTNRPADRSRMALRALAYQGLAVLLGLATFGLGWLYCIGAVLGAGRRTLYDEWSHTVVLARTH